MSCYAPNYGTLTYDHVDGKLHRRLVMQEHTKRHQPHVFPIPCRKCLNCLKERKLDWAIRISHELQYVKESSFITLTYADEHVPPEIKIKHFQDFLKRLRKKLEPRKIRHYTCAEYGSAVHTSRPHFHSIIFGYRFDIYKTITRKNKPNIYLSKVLEETWPFGYSSFGDVTPASCHYVAGYVMKKMQPDEDLKVWYDPVTHKMVDKQPETQIFSQQFGKQYVEDNIEQLFNTDYVVYNNKRMRLPRYYNELLKRHDPERYEQLRLNRVSKINDANHTDERLNSRKIIAQTIHKNSKLRGQIYD